MLCLKNKKKKHLDAIYSFDVLLSIGPFNSQKKITQHMQLKYHNLMLNHQSEK